LSQNDPEVQAKETQPPQLHNDGTLLHSMETAGRELEDEEEREAIKDCGIGTPSTRATIIERLLEVNYITRKAKTLIPTQKGIELIELMREHPIATPQMTGQWEKRLNDIWLNAADPDAFIHDVEQFCRNMIEGIKKDPSRFRIQHSTATAGSTPAKFNAKQK